MRNYKNLKLFYRMTGKEYNYILKKYGYTCKSILRIAHELGFTQLKEYDFNKWKKVEKVPKFVVVLLFLSCKHGMFAYFRKEWIKKNNFVMSNDT